MMRYIALALLPLSLALPARSPTVEIRQQSTDAEIAGAVANIFGSSFAPFRSSSNANAASTSSGDDAGGSSGTSVAFSNCAAGSAVSGVTIEPCEGGTGEDGSACVFTQGKNYTITIAFTSPADVAQAQARTGLASFDGDEQTAYSGQSFSACTYTSCPIQAGVAATYTYPFRTFAAPAFDRLVFNATNGVGGDSIMCADLPVSFKAA